MVKGNVRGGETKIYGEILTGGHEERITEGFGAR